MCWKILKIERGFTEFLHVKIFVYICTEKILKIPWRKFIVFPPDNNSCVCGVEKIFKIWRDVKVHGITSLSKFSAYECAETVYFIFEFNILGSTSVLRSWLPQSEVGIIFKKNQKICGQILYSNIVAKSWSQILKSNYKIRTYHKNNWYQVIDLRQ